jgi:hypothetical protein
MLIKIPWEKKKKLHQERIEGVAQLVEHLPNKQEGGREAGREEGRKEGNFFTLQEVLKSAKGHCEF